jgi:hypothetical protein
MSAPDPVPSERLAELLVSAAAQLSSPSGASLVPAGVPIRRGRLHLGRLRSLLDGAESVVGDPMAFDVVIVPAVEGGLLVVPWRTVGTARSAADQTRRRLRRAAGRTIGPVPASGCVEHE